MGMNVNFMISVLAVVVAYIYMSFGDLIFPVVIVEIFFEIHF
jgi:hypothetical protein